LQGQKNDFNEFQCLYLAIYPGKISEIFTSCSQVSILRDPTVTFVRKKKFQNFVLALEMAVLEQFW